MLAHNCFRRSPRPSGKQCGTLLQPRIKSLFFLISQLNMLQNNLVMLSHDLRKYSAEATFHIHIISAFAVWSASKD